LEKIETVGQAHAKSARVAMSSPLVMMKQTTLKPLAKKMKPMVIQADDEEPLAKPLAARKLFKEEKEEDLTSYQLITLTAGDCAENHAGLVRNGL